MQTYEVFLEQEEAFHRTPEKRILTIEASSKEHAIRKARMQFGCTFEHAEAFQIKKGIEELEAYLKKELAETQKASNQFREHANKHPQTAGEYAGRIITLKEALRFILKVDDDKERKA